MKKYEINRKRIRTLKNSPHNDGTILFWMQRDQRIKDNWALLTAQKYALESNSKLIVIFCLADNFLGATIRQYDFMIKGLREVESNLTKLNIPFKLLIGDPVKEIPKFIMENNCSSLITDFNPLKIIEFWQSEISNKITIPFYQVDAHNIVPCWEASNKIEFSARTIRPKLKRSFEEYLTDIPQLTKMEQKNFRLYKNKWDKISTILNIDKSVSTVEWIHSGESKAKLTLQNFIKNKLDLYHVERNNPNKDAQSNLSPYLHFGQISAQRVALEVLECRAPAEAKEEFLEELIIRRELSDNFCFYNKNYDQFEGFPDWAKRTLSEHLQDQREYVYSQEQWENASIHDDLWNAAQMELKTTGKMHGFMRMYWAKKILEWSSSPIEALNISIFLNDKYSLDGRDPNGYVGIAWSIGGVHDRAWAERNVYGKIRYMNYNGCKRKFDVNKYINTHLNDQKNLFSMNNGEN